MRTFATILIGAALIAGCGDAASNETRPPAVPLVVGVTVQPHRFVDRIDAIGTARANEQVTLAAPVTERIVRLNFKDGGFIAAGQVIAVLAQAEESATLASARAREREAGQQLSRIQALKDQGFATKASLDAQTAAAAAARADAAGARATIGDRTIRAPFSGYASLRTVSPGAIVTAGTEIATISDISRIKLDFTIPETLLSALRPGQPIAASAAAFPGEPFRGIVATIDPVINAETRAVTVRAILPNPDLRLKPGMLMTVTVEAAPRIAPAIPELAIVGQGEQRFVFVVDAQGKARRTEVRAGVRDGGLVEILQGLRPGQKVVGEGIVKVADGMTLRLTGQGDPVAGSGAPGAGR